MFNSWKISHLGWSFQIREKHYTKYLATNPEISIRKVSNEVSCTFLANIHQLLVEMFVKSSPILSTLKTCTWDQFFVTILRQFIYNWFTIKFAKEIAKLNSDMLWYTTTTIAWKEKLKDEIGYYKNIKRFIL